jgi:predicted O-methyltransferase YrrM
MIDYIGDISKGDAALLKSLAEQATAILEFGCGASTQVLAAYTKGAVTSVETNPWWITRTQENLTKLQLPQVNFIDYAAFDYSGSYDLIFDDGVDGERLPFALKAWKCLRVGGKFCFHDTRRSGDVRNVAELLKAFSPEIESLHLNANHSNITVITKKVAEFYDDWNVSEGRTDLQRGAV